MSLNPDWASSSGAYAVHRGRVAGFIVPRSARATHAAVWHGAAASAEGLHSALPAGLLNSTALGVSWDRRTVRVVGMAYTSSSRMSRAFLWTKDRCPADFNDDGSVDAADLAAFLAAFDDADDPFADLVDYNDDGFIDFFDWVAFLDQFEHGCPEPG